MDLIEGRGLSLATVVFWRSLHWCWEGKLQLMCTTLCAHYGLYISRFLMRLFYILLLQPNESLSCSFLNRCCNDCLPAGVAVPAETQRVDANQSVILSSRFFFTFLVVVPCIHQLEGTTKLMNLKDVFCFRSLQRRPLLCFLLWVLHGI